MKIGIDVSNLPKDNRGMGRYVRKILSCWSREKEEEFLFISSKKNLKECSLDIEKLWTAPLNVINEKDRLLKTLDVCFFPWNHLHFNTDCPRVVTIHDTTPFIYEKEERKLLESFERSARDSSHIITDSFFSRGEIIKFLEVEEKKISVINPGGGETLFDFPVAEAAEAEPPWKYILYVGADDVRKNLCPLIESFGWLKENYGISHHFVLVGIDGKNKKFEEIIRRHKIKEYLHFKGRITDTELHMLYKNALAFVLPSVYEGFGVPVVEALGYGIPMAVSSRSSIPELAGDAALYFDPENVEEMSRAILKLIEDENLRESLSIKAKERAKMFRWKKCAGEILKLLKKAAKEFSRCERRVPASQ